MAFGSRAYDAYATLRGLYLHNRSWRQHAYWQPERMSAYQFERLRALLIDAALHVPFYRKRFYNAGFDPASDFCALDDLSRVPVLTKSDVRFHKDELKRHPLPFQSVREATSGSTGQPLRVWISPRQIAVEKATVWRHWRGLGYRFRDPVAIVRTYVPGNGEPLWRHDRRRNFLYFSAYHLDDDNAARFLRVMQEYRPRFLRGYPSALAILSDAARSAGITIPRIQAILTASETLTPEVRDRLTSTFGAPVSDWYGLAEQTVTASECRAGRLHRHDDYGYWELLPLNDGTGRCRVIGTNLHNTAMPLIRYDTGDLAIPGEQRPCGCGCMFPTVERIAGREDDELRDPSGRRIPSVNFYSVFREFAAVRRFQMIQNRSDEVEVRLETSQLDPRDERELTQALRDRLGAGMTVRVVRDREFEKNPHGKRRVVISHLRREHQRTEAGA